MNAKRALSAFAVGVLFAIGLGVGGMTQPQKVLGFLNVWDWDPSLLFVMAGAVGVHAVLYPLVTKRRSPLLDVQWHIPSKKDIDANLILGAAIFGVGWGLAGYCPGPALTALSTGTVRPMLFVIFMIAGIYCHRRFSKI